jgi:acyl-CoA thioester hydrolase
MPAVFSHTLTVRYHECDAYGHVNNANYARYMQEAAFDASAAAGFPPSWYAENDRVFVVRASHIEFLQQAAYKDRLEIKTWISDARRVTARRQFEMRNADTGALVCTAHTDWVLAAPIVRSLIALPANMLAAFRPERSGTDAVKPIDLVQAAQAPQTFHQTRAVRWQELDAGRVVNNPVYLEYCTDCGFACTTSFGWPLTRQVEANTAVFFRTIDIDYLQPAMLDDELDIAAWLSDIKRVSATRHFLITRTRDNTVLARMNAMIVCADLTTGRPMRWTEQMRADLAQNVSAEGMDGV